MADKHVEASREEVVGSHYSGSHWLASFLFYALDRREDAVKAMGSKKAKSYRNEETQ